MLGVVLVVVGVTLLFVQKVPFLGKLPGDIIIKREHFTFSFPLMTSIIISIIISLILSMLSKLR